MLLEKSREITPERILMSPARILNPNTEILNEGEFQKTSPDEEE